MANPARELHAMLSQWRRSIAGSEGRQSVYTARGSLQGPAATMKAIALLEQIVKHIDSWETAGRDVAVHRRNIAAITNSLLVFPGAWQEATRAETAHPQATMDALEMWAELIDFAGSSFIPPLVDVKVNEFVELVRSALDEDETIPDVFRGYINAMLSAVTEAMGHRDSEKLREDLEHLWIAVFAAENVSADKGKWGDLVKRFGWDTFTQTVGSLAGNIASKMITGG